MKIEIRTRLPLPHDILNKPAQEPYQHLWAFGNQGSAIWRLWEAEGYKLTCDIGADVKPVPFSAIIVRQDVEISLRSFVMSILRRWIPGAKLPVCAGK